VRERPRLARRSGAWRQARDPAPRPARRDL